MLILVDFRSRYSGKGRYTHGGLTIVILVGGQQLLYAPCDSVRGPSSVFCGQLLTLIFWGHCSFILVEVPVLHRWFSLIDVGATSALFITYRLRYSRLPATWIMSA